MASSMELLTDRLIKEASISEDDQTFAADDYAALETALKEAIEQHNSSYSATTLPENEIPLIMLLARIKICHVRAQQLAENASVTGASGIGADRNTPFDKLMRLAKMLKDQYNELCDQLGVPASGSANSQVTVSSAKVRSSLLGTVIPFEANAPTPVTLRLVEQSDTSATLEWSFKNFTDFRRFIVVITSRLIADTVAVPAIQKWNVTGNAGIPGINSGSTLVYLSNPSNMRQAIIDDIDLTTNVYRMCLVIESTAGNYSYSNEIEVAATT